MKTILIASDHAGFGLKEKIKLYLQKTGFKVNDLGTYSEERCDYPEFAARLAKLIPRQKNSRGILICGSGIGVAIVANRFKGVRAAVCHNIQAAEFSRRHNDSNVLALGARIAGLELQKKILKIWLNTKFEGGRHRRRLNLLKRIEEEITK
ncbi:MAG: ribose 5-phosphate isomerase B [Candidatus Omnitrophica bacterium]|nr:ribose 5-phosphate isomerase B [Candidatus Omnitrophota bacterium]